MNKKKKRIPINSAGKLIKEAREKQGLSIEELVWKINKPAITKKVISNWEKGQEFPDLNNIYLLAEHLDLNPNELLNKRLTIQDESIHEVNSAGRRIGGKLFEASFIIVKRCVKWIMVICLIYLVITFKDFELKMGQDPEQYELVEDIMINAINEYTGENLVNEDRDAYINSMPPLKRYKDMKDKELYNSWKKSKNTIDDEEILQNSR